MSFHRALAITSKRLYDLVASYLLAYLLPFAITALLFHLAAQGLAALLGYPDQAMLFARAARAVPLSPVALRIVVFLPLHVLVWRGTRRPRKAIKAFLERDFDRTAADFERIVGQRPALRVAAGLLYSLVVTAMLIPFVIQPTLVPGGFGGRAWTLRAANLLDGTATAEVVDSVVGFYRRFYAQPVVAGGVSAQEFEAGGAPLTVAGEGAAEDARGASLAAQARPLSRPMMDRWDPLLWDAADNDPQRFAVLKAFLFVESRGRQYAVSPTGCSGLMQFCSGTARARPFRSVFGVGQVYVCDCDGACRVDRAVQRDLESGDLALVQRRAHDFPCELTDARFDPAKSIEAGALYVQRLDAAYDGNLPLMYIGYNSGPLVADAVWAALGENADATLADIEPHLAVAMTPYYGADAQGRADGLLRGTLPDLENAFDAYRSSEPDRG